MLNGSTHSFFAAEQTNIRQPHIVQASSLYLSHSVWSRTTKIVVSTL